MIGLIIGLLILTMNQNLKSLNLKPMMEKLKRSGLVIMYLKMSGSHLEGIREKIS